MWHVHGGWTDSFVLGSHEILFPTTPARDAWGLGRGGRAWPASAREVDPSSLHETHVDLVLLQRVPRSRRRSACSAAASDPTCPPSSWSTTPRAEPRPRPCTRWPAATTSR